MNDKVSSHELTSIETLAISIYMTKHPRPTHPWTHLDRDIRERYRAIALDMTRECSVDVAEVLTKRRTPRPLSASVVGVKNVDVTQGVNWPEIKLEASKRGQKDGLIYAEAALRSALGDDLERTMSWAYFTLALQDGAGHKFQFRGNSLGHVSAEFAKPEWNGSMVGKDYEFAAWAVQSAVAQYLLGG